MRPARGFSVAATGNDAHVFGRRRRKREQHRADKQQGDVDALDRKGDPRGGVQSDEYRHADPREVVQAEDIAMSGPAGAPQEGESVAERRARDRS
jgi:hypothetical protein